MKTEEKIGCGEMFCYMCDRLDESHSAYCSLHGRSAHYICGKDGLCPSCQKKKDNQVVILDDNELSIMQYAKEFPDNWKKICKSLEKDNHNQVGQDVGAINQAPMGNDNSLNPTAIQQSKVFEDIFGLIDEWAIEHKTSWKYLKRKGFQNAEEFGDVIILDINNHLDGIYPTAIENLKSKIKEKWGKIER